MTNMLPFDFPLARPVDATPMIIDSFAGGGGASSGIEAALGRSPDVAINHDAAAISMHEVNHPNTRHYNCNIWHADPQDVAKGRRVGLAWFSPDCFPSGTHILTETGYRPIENISVGDLVLTHKNRWRKVTKTMQTKRALLSVTGQGSPEIFVSGEHPFYVRSAQTDEAGNADGTNAAPLSAPRWVKASDLTGKASNTANSFLATPNTFDPLPIPGISSLQNGQVSLDAVMWIAGHYLATGSIDLGGHREIASSDDQDSIESKALASWLRGQFGDESEEKRVPGWALGMEEAYRIALLKGFLGVKDEGPVADKAHETQSTSQPLVLGLKSLAESLGYAAHIQRSLETLGKPAYLLRWSTKTAASEGLRDGGHSWCPLHAVSETGRTEIVYNLSVEEDESYVAQSVVVHNCTHHSKAKGGKPVSKGRRDLAWVVVLWAKRVRPEIIMLENVEEFRDWGPLDENQRPCKKRKGQTFRKWVSELERLGYTVEFRELRACDFGAPTIRKRLFMVARCDGRPIVWPKPTHGAPDDPRVLSGELKRYRTAADIIDWSVPCPSIFETKEQIKDALGINVRRPLVPATLRRIARGVMRYAVNARNPYIVQSEKGDALPALVQTGYGERKGQAPRALDPNAPIGTMVAGGAKHGVITAFLAQHNAGPGMINNSGRAADAPLSTLTTSGSQQGIVTASLLSLHGNDRRDSDIRTPHPTLCAGGTHSAVVTTFLQSYNSSDLDAQTVQPSDTSTTLDQVQPTTVSIDGQTYVIADIGMRMLNVPEMYRAQGFRADYIFDRGSHGRVLTKSEQTRMCGNSVSPPVAEALVAANAGHLAVSNPVMAA